MYEASLDAGARERNESHKVAGWDPEALYSRARAADG
jgi:hypothetical protein